MHMYVQVCHFHRGGNFKNNDATVEYIALCQTKTFDLLPLRLIPIRRDTINSRDKNKTTTIIIHTTSDKRQT